MIVRSTIRCSAYHDSITLMRAQTALRAMPGIAEAGVVMGTEANLDLLRQAGLDPGGLEARPDDLVVAVAGEAEADVQAALDALDGLLSRETAGGAAPAGAAAFDGGGAGVGYRPHTVAAAARMLAHANLALVSVPGRFAAGVAREALEAGLHVLLFSDNVPLGDEVRLKRDALARGRLLMGPDCGTALIAGIALGFANRVRRGPVGLVGAAGTGLQEVSSLIHRWGGGISHAIGTGGRDLSAEVGGATAACALAALGDEPETGVVVLVSKPPHPGVAARLRVQAAGLRKPVVMALIGAAANGQDPVTLEGAARRALDLAGIAPEGADDAGWHDDAAGRARNVIERLAPSQRFLRGLYSGGTLCAECVSLLAPALRPLRTNVPGGAAGTSTEPHEGVGPSRGHTVLDLGADLFTVGRLHPMLDMTLRTQRLIQESADPEVAVVLLDVVLGEGVHPDPAGALGPAITSARVEAGAAGRHVAVVASVSGTDEDPQGRARQVERLRESGVIVEGSNARAAVLAGMIAARRTDLSLPAPPAGGAVRPSGRAARSVGRETRAPGRGGVETSGISAGHPGASLADLLSAPPRVVNVGLPIFAESLRAQGAAVIDVDWQPPAGGDREMLDLLERLK